MLSKQEFKQIEKALSGMMRRGLFSQYLSYWDVVHLLRTYTPEGKLDD